MGRRRLVDGVTFAVDFGELIAVVGPNGAGKTTLLRLLAGELSPSSGGVELAGRPLASYPARELALTRSVLPQESSLEFAFTVGELVAMGRYPHRRRGPEAKREDAEVVARALHAADAAHLVDRAWTTLSGGERARVAAARVLAQDTPVLFLDEPTASLDLRHQHLLLREAVRRARAGRAVVAVLHDLTLAAAVADRVAVLREGRLDVLAPPWEALTPGRLRSVFETEVVVSRHPASDRPLVVTPPPDADDPGPTAGARAP